VTGKQPNYKVNPENRTVLLDVMKVRKLINLHENSKIRPYTASTCFFFYPLYFFAK
jgi:hypothetical protein